MTLAGLLGLIAVTRITEGHDSAFAAALQEAQRASSVEPLKSYLAGPFGQTFGQHYIDWLNQCSQKTQQSAGAFDLLITIGVQGAVTEVRYEPKTPATDCFAGPSNNELKLTRPS